MNLAVTLSCGQCFRFSQDQDGYWNGIAGIKGSEHRLHTRQCDQRALEDDPFWHHYFSFDRDYEAIESDLRGRFEILDKAMDAVGQIRILSQDPWETLGSFILSQNNNIKRIRGMVERLCRGSGFPSAEEIVQFKDFLCTIGLGFRDKYLYCGAASIAQGKLDLKALSTMSTEEARKALMTIYGVGPKVADCTLLYGLGRYEVCPMDVWMKRVMEAWFNGESPSILGPYAGVAQQYLFHYARMIDLK